MTKRRFSIDITITDSNYDEEYCDGIIELDQAVIDAVTDEWRSNFYSLRTPEDIAEHIAYNVFVNNATLTMLDGWADQSDDMVTVIKYPYFQKEYDYYTTEYEFEVKEIV